MDGKKFLKEFNILHEELNNLWKEIGLSEKEKEEREEYCSTLIMKGLREIKEKEIKIREKLIRNINELGQQLLQLCQDLHIPAPCEPETDMSLTELEKYLKEKLSICEKEALERKQSLKALQFQESVICARLGEEPMHIPSSQVPSIETIDHLTRVIKTLETEAYHRQKTFQRLKASILASMEELEIEASTPLQRDLVIGSDEFIILSKRKLNEMDSLSEELQHQVELSKEKEKKLKDNIFLLWERLSIDQEKRNLVLNELSSKTIKNIPKLEAELNDLEHLKHQNLARLTNHLKRELEEWWEKCYISEDEKDDFSPYFSAEYSGRNLEEHEKEVSRLKEFYTQNENIFMKIKRWQTLWKKMTELEEKAADPARLFGNRGCVLLQEEKERKSVNKELPLVEHELDQMMKKWEKEKGQPFLISGMTLNKFITSHWEEYNEKKTKEKIDRTTSRSKRLQLDSQVGSSRTPQRKRHMFQSETLRGSKYLRTNSNERTSMNPSSSTTISTRSSSSHSAAVSQKTSRRAPLRKMSSRNQPSFRRNNEGTFRSTTLSSNEHFLGGGTCLSERENIQSSVVKKSPRSSVVRNPLRGISKTPVHSSSRFTTFPYPASVPKRRPFSPNCQATSHQNFIRPKASSTTPRRRSARLINSSKSFLLNSRNTLSPGNHSQRSGLSAPRFTTPIRNRLNFLM